MAKQSQIEKAIAQLEYEINVLEAAISKLKQQQKAPKSKLSGIPVKASTEGKS